MLACAGPRSPLLTSATCWFDGAAVWQSLPADSAQVAALRAEPVCQLQVAGPPGSAVVVRAVARVHGLHDRLGLALHAPVVATAMAAVAARAATGVLAVAADRSAPSPLAPPRNRVAVRLAVEQARLVALPAPGPGVGPALPPVVAPAIRRALAGRRDVGLATRASGGVEVGPVAWGAGFALHLPEDRRVTDGTPAVAALETVEGGLAVGLAVAGTVMPGPVLRPLRVTSWRGGVLHDAELPDQRGALTLPD